MATTHFLTGWLVRARLPRPMHPVAWWTWAVLVAIIVSKGTNPLLIAGLLSAVTLVVLARRGDNPWAKSFRIYVYIGVFIIVMRVFYRVIFGGGDGPTILFRLPYIPLPYWVGGIRLLGPVSLEALLAGFYDGMRLAGVIVCLGAANALVNPKRLIASLPAAFYEIGTILIVALGVFPQLGDSVQRVMRARKLRPISTHGGRFSKYRIVRTIIIPVLSDALDRCLALAASMDARGYGRAGNASRSYRTLTTILILLSLIAISMGCYGELNSRLVVGYWTNLIFSQRIIIFGIVLGFVGLWLAGRHVQRTIYRRELWRLGELLLISSGIVALWLVNQVSDSTEGAIMVPTTNPFEWPTINLALLLVILVVALPAFITPPPRLSSAKDTQMGVS